MCVCVCVCVEEVIFQTSFSRFQAHGRATAIATKLVQVVFKAGIMLCCRFPLACVYALLLFLFIPEREREREKRK